MIRIFGLALANHFKINLPTFLPYAYSIITYNSSFRWTYFFKQSYLEKAVSIVPNYSSFGYLIEAYLISGQKVQAEKILNQALNIFKDDSHKNSLRNFLKVSTVQLPIDIGI